MIARPSPLIKPPHCPNPDCRHYIRPDSSVWYQNAGTYRTITFGTVPRFVCKSCGRSFSTQTFSIDYFAKRRVNYQYVYNQINAGAGVRNIARDLGLRDSTITNRIHRMARNAILINQAIADHLPAREDLVIDGLQNFCVSQYFPDNSTIVVGKSSQFAYDCDYATLRRCGRMTAQQKHRRKEIEKTYRADPKAVKRSFQRLLRSIERRIPQRSVPLILYTDEKKDYLRALWDRRKGIAQQMFDGTIRHHMTHSKEPRNQNNPLFAVNYFDREIRKDMASHARETVQFPRNVCNAMLRLNLYMFDHNVRKPYRIRDRRLRELSHAEAAGADRDVLGRLVWGFFQRRVFRPPDLVLSESQQMTLNREWMTPLKKNPEVRWKYMSA